MNEIEALKKAIADQAAAKSEAEGALEVATLKATLEAGEKHGAGRRGRTWEVVASSEGPFVVVRGDMMHFRSYQAAVSAEGATPLDLAAAQREFALAQITNMAREEAEQKFNLIPGVIVRIADALTAMHRGEDASRVEKR